MSTGQPVKCYVYDITQGMAKVLSPGLIGKQIDLVPHTGIVCWGREYFFGGGVCVAPAGQAVPMQPCQVLDLGVSEKTQGELEVFLREISPRFTQETYNLLTHNCNHFANEVALFLTGGKKGVPEEIVNIAETALSTPQGQQLRGMIEGFESSMRGNMQGGSAMNPFGNVQSGGAGSSATGSTAPTATAPAAAPAPTTAAAGPSSASSNDPATADLHAALTELNTVEAASTEKRRACLTTLVKMTSNIVDKPGEEKFRKIKMDNKAFNSKVSEVGGGTELVLALGFSPEEIDGVDHWKFKEGEPVSMDLLKSKLLPALKKELEKLGPDPNAAPPKTAAAVPSMQGGGAMGGMPTPNSNPLLQGGMAGGGMGGMGGGMGGMGGGAFPPMGGMGGPGMPPGGMGGPGGPGMPSPQMMAQAQQMMQNNPQLAAQAQQMMQNPQMMQQMMQMFGGQGPR